MANDKEEARQLAIDWQHQFADMDYSCSDLYEWQQKFYKIGKRYGLLKEFKENGVI